MKDVERIELIRRIQVISDGEAAVLRHIPGARRVAMVDQLCEFGRELMLSRLRDVHPEWTDQQRQQEVARRLASAT